MGQIHPAVSEICVPQSLDPICGKFDKFLAHGQAHMGQMGKWPWQCTTTGLDNSSELRMEKIRQAVTEIWVPQVWQPPARPPARTVTTIPLQPEGLRGKKMDMMNACSVINAAPRPIFLTFSSRFFQASSRCDMSSIQCDKVERMPAVVALNVKASPLKSMACAPCCCRMFSVTRKMSSIKKCQWLEFSKEWELIVACTYWCWNRAVILVHSRSVA